MSRMFDYATFDQTGKAVLTTLEGQYKDMLMNITVYDMKQGEQREFFLEQEEMAILLVEGRVHYHLAGQVWEAARTSFIKEGPYCIHVAKKNKVVIIADSDSEILVQSTINNGDFEYHFYTPEHCPESVAGKGLYKGKATRTIRTVFDYHNAPYSNMVLGEVISEPGGWSSYIPHHHPQPEVYYYRYERPEGFGACFIGDNAFKVMDKSFAAIPGGLTHPQASAPGYSMYYIWMIRHFEGNPWTDRIDDPRFAWLLSEKE